MVLASLRAHLGRLVAACVAIVIGVGFATLALTARSSAAHGVDEFFGAQYAGVDAVVLPDGDILRDRDLAAIRRLGQVDGVLAIGNTYLQVTWPGTARPSYLHLQARTSDPRFPEVTLTSGRLPVKPGEIALPTRQAEKRKVALGTKLTIHPYDDKPTQVTVVGTIEDGGAVGIPAGLATPAAIRAWDPTAGYSEIRIGAKPGVTPAELVAAVDRTVQDSHRVMTKQARVDEEVSSYTNGIDVLGGVFGTFAAIALFVACLVIANTFTILLAQRTRQMALLRCVGASRRQVFSSVLAEAAVIGVVASAVGVGFGLLLAMLGLALEERFDWGVPSLDVHADLLALLLPFVLGFVATMLAAVVPARRATRVAPLAALRPEAAPAVASKAGLLRLVLGFLLLAGGGLLLVAGATGHQVVVGAAGGMVSFLGVLAIGSLLVPALIRLTALPARAGGVPARIAVGNAVRNPRRTAATTSALLIGVTLISLTCVGIGSIQRSFDQVMDSEYPIDLVVSSGRTPMPGPAEGELRAISGVAAVVPVHGLTARVGRDSLQITGVDPGAARSVVRGQSLDRLAPGVALIPPGFRTDGTEIPLTVGGRTIRVRGMVSGGVEDPVLTATDLRRLAPDAPVVGFWIDAAAKADAGDVVDAVEQSIPGVPSLTVSGGLQERAAYTKVFDVLLIVAIALLGVSVLIALVGVGNTLSLSVLERTRENALLRALGLTRAQLRAMLAFESLLMAIVATGLGVTLGLLYGWAGTAALMGNEVDHIQYAIPLGQLTTITLTAAVAGLLASLLPARRASRIPPATALATE